MAVANNTWSKSEWAWSEDKEASNGGEMAVAFVALPDADKDRELLARLVTRSCTEDGLDRALLLRIDQEAWGTPDE